MNRSDLERLYLQYLDPGPGGTPSSPRPRPPGGLPFSVDDHILHARRMIARGEGPVVFAAYFDLGIDYAQALWDYATGAEATS